ncbi:hypothetical protein [Kitasatospora viridis]|uniref:Uncharacterized protein n=1 Tax=Kitasatospora viridis TaxID=281105 RepID=A0A561UC19_9ACTN|nr:hypothetical protein [Kitasatospora viridis]TWF96889.1 hypothetical protein FHX73_11663 [Kitasatospora viridis]
MRPLRLFATALVALGTLLAGTTTATAAAPTTAAVTATTAAPTTVRPHGITGSAGAGYALTGSGITQAGASWVQPFVDCTSGGAVQLWVGLDGLTASDPGVEQIGTQVDCNGGNGHYYGFYSAGGTKQAYGGNVLPEDNMAAAVVQVPHTATYQIAIIDYTQNWSATEVVTAANAQNASAEVMVSAGGTSLAQFGYNGFTAVSLDNTALTSTATAVTLDNPAGGTATPTALSANHNFGVAYGASTAPETGQDITAVQAGIPRNQVVYNWTPAGSGYTGQSILRNTSPSVVILPDGGWEEAIMTAYKTLVIIGSDYTWNTGLALAGGSSPSLAVSSNGTLEVAYEASSGHLCTFTPNSNPVDTQLQMTGSSTPSIAALAGGGFEIAYVANTGVLAFTGPEGTGLSTNYVRGGTNPSIVAESGNGYLYAFQATDSTLWIGSYGIPAIRENGITLAAGTSPSAAWLSGGSEVAYESSNGQINWTGLYTSTNGPASVGSSSPSITAYAGEFQVTYQSTAFQLALTSPMGTMSTGLGMAGTGTSPSTGT